MRGQRLDAAHGPIGRKMPKNRRARQANPLVVLALDMTPSDWPQSGFLQAGPAHDKHEFDELVIMSRIIGMVLHHDRGNLAGLGEADAPFQVAVRQLQHGT